MTDVVDGTMGNARLMTSLLTLFGLVGLGLGAIGVYGVTAQVVSERRKEIGIRIALGAERTGVARRTIVQGLFLTAPTALVLVALALPAVRASRVDPVRTLREE
jgi:putative ABC transport system permease protein